MNINSGLCRFILVVFTIILLLLPFYGKAQEELADTTEQKAGLQSWFTYQPQIRIGESFMYQGNAAFRALLSSDFWATIFYRPDFYYQMNENVSFGTGAGFYLTQQVRDTNTFETRLWQGVKGVWPSKTRYKLTHFVRVEERFSYIIPDWTLSYSTRLRYKFSTNIGILNKRSPNTWQIPLSIEFFIPIDKNFQERFRNRSRIETGVSKMLDSGMKITVHSTFQRSRTGSDEELQYSDFIIGVKLKKEISKKK